MLPDAAIKIIETLNEIRIIVIKAVDIKLLFEKLLLLLKNLAINDSNCNIPTKYASESIV